MMRRALRSTLVLIVLALIAVSSFASAYNAQPRLVVIIVVDQLRGDLLERYHDDFPAGGFRRLMDDGAWFTSCYYNYSATMTAPGHATIGTGSYTLGHGILGNEWWNPAERRMVTSVEDEGTHQIGLPEGVEGEKWSSSPHNLRTDTIGDELKLATGGVARVYGVSFKDRAAILPVGFAADAAFFLDPQSGYFVTSSYYMQQPPEWLVKFNAGPSRASYLNREVKDAAGHVWRSTAPATNDKGKPVGYYELVGPTPFGNDYTVELAEQIIANEKLGHGEKSDLLSINFAPVDILGHKVGPDSPEQKHMLLSLDRTLSYFFDYLDQQVGRGQWVVALTADHGIAPMSDYASKLRVPALNFSPADLQHQLNTMLAAKYSRPGEYVVNVGYPTVHLDAEAFAAVNVAEPEAERAVGELMLHLGFRTWAGKAQLAAGEAPNTVFRQAMLNTYSPLAGWYVIGLMPPFQIGGGSGTNHGVPYSYDAHVPLAFYGPGFRAAVIRNSVEPVDLAVTLSSLLGINKPASAVGRVLTGAFADPQH